MSPRLPQSGGRHRQGVRFREQFDRLKQALAGENAKIALRQDPAGIAPERALVFVTAVPIPQFIKVAEEINLEVFSEIELGDDYELEEGIVDSNPELAKPTLYATMPSEDVLNRILRLWGAYQSNKAAVWGSAPWWKLFDMLAELRTWGPQDRFNESSRIELENRLPFDGESEVRIELEIWPTRDEGKREQWRRDTEARVVALGARIVSTSSISEVGFIYEAVLIAMSAASVRAMLATPCAPEGLASLDGLKFILPQTVGQSMPTQSDPMDQADGQELAPFDKEAPLRVVLLDGTPIAAHQQLNGGVVIEDVHGLVPNSMVADRLHATTMASLILRGDILADGSPLEDSRLLSIPILVDGNQDTHSPVDRLFVDLVHIALARAFLGDEPLAPDAFVVNFSIGIRGAHFTGLISALARLMDWWADTHGVLFIVSAGNVMDNLVVPGVKSIEFEEMSSEDRACCVEEAQRMSRHQRTLLAPSEALNVVSVGAASIDLAEPVASPSVNEVNIERGDGVMPALSSAIGPGPFRSIKPDFLHIGGTHNVVMIPQSGNLNLRVVARSNSTGLYVASTGQGTTAIARSRGTSCANALATRAHLNSAAALTGEDGPYEGRELARRDLALLTRALSINSSRWPNSAFNFYNRELAPNRHKHLQAKQEVARYYGHGLLIEQLMLESPVSGATLVGLGTLRKDGGLVFDLPIPPSLSGERIGRSMYVTIAWFSPVDPVRAKYRLASMQAVVADYDEDAKENGIKDNSWKLELKSGHLDDKLIKRGTVWSKRLVKHRPRVPEIEEGDTIPIRVQCSDASGGGLDSNDDIRFAIAVTLEVEVEFDIHAEIEDAIRMRV